LKKISILGSTGSIGTQTLDIVRINKDIKVVGLSANSNVDLLLKQIEEFEPELVCVFREDKACELKERLGSLKIGKYPEVVSGMEGLISCAVIPSAEMVVTAFVGMIGIRPTIEAIKSGKDIALANKETLVTAGHIIMPLAKENNVRILPVDSEHSAIFQCLNGESVNKIEKILLTASGGPFRGKTLADLKNVTLADALKHPNWSMGKKITIDSSTMVNKGLEVMEAGWLFGVELDDIQVVIQPKSIIHSMVQFKDGCVMAQLGLPDMRAPISYALYYPERRYIDGRSLDFWDLKSIEFDRPDPDTFKGLSLALRAGKEGGSMPTVFNAANEKAVSLFLNEKIGYLTITEIIEEMMDKIPVIKNPSLDEILETEKEVYAKIDESRGF
jgi:1-deoxy-D-xylulose-5-phosphate reductoisomerase